MQEARIIEGLSGLYWLLLSAGDGRKVSSQVTLHGIPMVICLQHHLLMVHQPQKLGVFYRQSRNEQACRSKCLQPEHRSYYHRDHSPPQESLTQCHSTVLPRSLSHSVSPPLESLTQCHSTELTGTPKRPHQFLSPSSEATCADRISIPGYST